MHKNGEAAARRARGRRIEKRRGTAILRSRGAVCSFPGRRDRRGKDPIAESGAVLLPEYDGKAFRKAAHAARFRHDFPQRRGEHPRLAHILRIRKVREVLREKRLCRGHGGIHRPVRKVGIRGNVQKDAPPVPARRLSPERRPFRHLIFERTEAELPQCKLTGEPPAPHPFDAPAPHIHYLRKARQKLHRRGKDPAPDAPLLVLAQGKERLHALRDEQLHAVRILAERSLQGGKPLLVRRRAPLMKRQARKERLVFAQHLFRPRQNCRLHADLLPKFLYHPRFLPKFFAILPIKFTPPPPIDKVEISCYHLDENMK